MTRYAHITGWGMAVPDRILTNEEISKMVDTSDEWIVSRTGIRERRIAGKGESTASLAAGAGAPGPGFILALNMAAQAIISGSINNALVIGSETLSRLVDWEDRGTCVLFGDGAGAFVLQASERPGGVLSAVMRSDGSGGKLLSIPAGGSRHPTTHATAP